MRAIRVSTRSNNPRAQKRKNENVNKDAQLKTKKAKLEAVELPREKKASTHINDFPPHILGIIFSKLPLVDRLRAEKVCRFWRNINVAGYGWTNQVAISSKDLNTGIKYMESKPEDANRYIEISLKRSRHYLRTLDLSGFQYHEFVKYSICSSFQHVRNLHTLNLSTLHLTNSSLSLIGRHLPNLKKISFCHSFKNTNMERGLASLFSCCQKLEDLDLSGNELLAGTSFSDLPSTLIVLNISTCYRIKMEGLRSIQQNCVNLQKLVMNQLDTISTVHLNDMFRSLKNLKVLHFSECYGSEFYDGQPSLISIGDLPKLTELHLCDNILVNNDVLRAISIGCKSLEILDIALSSRHVTDMGLNYLGNMTSLTELNLLSQRALTDDALIQIVNRGTLKELFIGKCTGITNVSVLQAIKMCKNLKTLDVSHCLGVTPAIFKELDKTMSTRHGKTQPNGANDERKFRLSITRSGIHNNLPDKYSSWIKIVDYCPHHASSLSPAFLFAHFLDFPMAAGILLHG